MTAEKETNHFVSADFDEFADEYWSMFDLAFDEQPLGEASVSYAESEYVDLASRRLHQHNPDLKVIFLVRDPVKRIESQYRELHDSGVKVMVRCPFDLGEAMLKANSLIADTHYHRLTQRYISLFGEGQVHVVFLEELTSQPDVVLRDVLAFLDVHDRDFKFNTDKQHNSGQTKYRDTLFFRKLKEVRAAGILNSPNTHLSYNERERFYCQQGWRRPFANEPIV